MDFRIEKLSGIGEYEVKQEENVTKYLVGGKVFLVLNFGGEGKVLKTLEVRCDRNLSSLLQERYESVMRSRYFGKGGVEIVPTQLDESEIYDLARLSYNLTLKILD